MFRSSSTSPFDSGGNVGTVRVPPRNSRAVHTPHALVQARHAASPTFRHVWTVHPIILAGAGIQESCRTSNRRNGSRRVRQTSRPTINTASRWDSRVPPAFAGAGLFAGMTSVGVAEKVPNSDGNTLQQGLQRELLNRSLRPTFRHPGEDRGLCCASACTALVFCIV